MRPADLEPTPDQALWVVIRNSTNALSFEKYQQFIESIMPSTALTPRDDSRPENRVEFARERIHNRDLPFPNVEPYRLLEVASDVFMMAHCASLASVGFTDVDQDLPLLWNVIRLRLDGIPTQEEHALAVARQGYAILMAKVTNPCFLELLWNYWHEEGMLVQSMNAIIWRFRNRPRAAGDDPLAMLEPDPLRPLSNLLWGWVQDEEHRLTIPRRSYEYDHEYGLQLIGKAVPQTRSAGGRSRFLEGFHNLVYLSTIFYREDDDTTTVADGFPLLRALRDVHLALSEGAHNQYGDLPWTARREFLMIEWILAQPEMREFLPSRATEDYPEPWMDPVETMKTAEGWTGAPIRVFRDIAILAEKIVLSVRYGRWTNGTEPDSAANWARYWRPEIQGYVHAYQAATGIDLTKHPDATLPSLLLRQRSLSE